LAHDEKQKKERKRKKKERLKHAPISQDWDIWETGQKKII